MASRFRGTKQAIYGYLEQSGQGGVRGYGGLFSLHLARSLSGVWIDLSCVLSQASSQLSIPSLIHTLDIHTYIHPSVLSFISTPTYRRSCACAYIDTSAYLCIYLATAAASMMPSAETSPSMRARNSCPEDRPLQSSAYFACLGLERKSCTDCYRVPSSVKTWSHSCWNDFPRWCWSLSRY